MKSDLIKTPSLSAPNIKIIEEWQDVSCSGWFRAK